MFWWRGSGLVALILVALCVVGAGQAFGEPHGATIGLGTAAILVFLMRGVWDEGSSAFSMPVRFWPIGLAVLCGLTLIM
jgi:hypothetical protein